MTPGRSVLIVVSSYAPAMMADMHRARLLAWELPAHGWNVEVLAPDTSVQFPNSIDADSAGFFCPDTPVHRAAAPGTMSRWLVRSNSIGWRALLPLAAAGSRTLESGRFDLVYFSTTQFNLFMLGPWWRGRHGVPYLIDLHDPIWRPRAPDSHLGGSAIRRDAQRRIARAIESRALRSTTGIVSVSSVYLDELRARYGRGLGAGIPDERQAVIPFAASERDHEEARARMPASPGDPRGAPRIIYVGAGGRVMARAFGTFCRALRKAIDRRVPGSDAVRIELYGTMFTWREGDACELKDIATQAGVGGLVDENPARVSYRRSLELLLGADGALVLGVDDNGYVPSKLYSYALSGKPVLGVLRAGSEGARAMRHIGFGGTMLYGTDDIEDASPVVMAKFIADVCARRQAERVVLLKDHLADTMAQAHATLFERCLRERRATT